MQKTTSRPPRKPCKPAFGETAKFGEHKMSIETILIIVVVLFLLGGGGWYWRGRG